MRGQFDLKASRRSHSFSRSAALARNSLPTERPETGELSFRCPVRLVDVDSGIAMDRHTLKKSKRVPFSCVAPLASGYTNSGCLLGNLRRSCAAQTTISTPDDEPLKGDAPWKWSRTFESALMFPLKNVRRKS
jgi:hypothetical protein